MKTLSIIFISLLFCFSNAIAQFEQEHLVSNEVHSRTIFAVDIDGDTDIDIVSSSTFEHKIFWHENIDGLGTYSPKKIITTEAEGPLAVFTADMDSDGDMDVLSYSDFNGRKIAWYENLDGEGNFGEIQILTTEVNGLTVHANDLDGDGDMDILFGGSNDTLVWCENLDGQGNFGPQKIITTFVDALSCIYTEDLDNDGDIDVISAAKAPDNRIAWYKNIDGLGNFNSQTIINNDEGHATSVFAADLDNDGDMDVLSTSSLYNRVSWYENQDGLGDFSDMQIIDSNAYSVRNVFAADLDNDGDNDVVAASESSSELGWYENLDGDGTFSDEIIITTEVLTPVYVFVADLDGDNDNDIILSDDTLRTITWYENSVNLSVDENDISKIDIYPNPSNEIIHIESHYSINTIKVFDVLGKLLLEQNNPSNQIDISNLSNGLLFIQIETDNGSLVKKVIKD